MSRRRPGVPALLGAALLAVALSLAAAPSAGAQETLPRNLSPWGMFLAADLVVKAVTIRLVLASVATWTVMQVKADLTLALGAEAVAPDALAGALAAMTGGDGSRQVFLRADRSVAYGDLMAVMNRLMDAGYPRIVLLGLDRGQGQ